MNGVQEGWIAHGRLDTWRRGWEAHVPAGRMAGRLAGRRLAGGRPEAGHIQRRISADHLGVWESPPIIVL